MKCAAARLGGASRLVLQRVKAPEEDTEINRRAPGANVDKAKHTRQIGQVAAGTACAACAACAPGKASRGAGPQSTGPSYGGETRAKPRRTDPFRQAEGRSCLSRRGGVRRAAGHLALGAA